MRRGLVRGPLEGQRLLGLTSIGGGVWEGPLGGLWVLPPPPALTLLLSTQPWLLVTQRTLLRCFTPGAAAICGRAVARGSGGCSWQGRPLPGSPPGPANPSASMMPHVMSRVYAGATPPAQAP